VVGEVYSLDSTLRVEMKVALGRGRIMELCF